jgi:hypothetical protein
MDKERTNDRLIDKDNKHIQSIDKERRNDWLREREIQLIVKDRTNNLSELQRQPTYSIDG